MKKYQLILMVAVLSFTACSQKEESPKVTQKDKSVNVSKEEVVTKKAQTISTPTPPSNEAISTTYIESVEAELNKIKESTPTTESLVSSYEEENLAPVPDHIKNSTIQSVPH